MTNPFTDLIPSSGISSANPFADLISSPDTALGRRQMDTVSIQNNIDTLKNIRLRASPAQQTHIDKLIKNLEDQKEGFTRPGDEHNPFSDIIRGAVAGVARGPLSIAELAATVPALMGSDRAEQLRQSLAERGQTISETINPQGFTGAAGEFIGELPAQTLGIGPVAGGTLAITATGLKKLGAEGAAKLLTESVEGNLAKRMAIGGGRSAVAMLPISILQAAGMTGAPTEDKIKQFLLSETGAAIFGTLDPAKATKVAKATATATAEAGETVPTEGAAPKEGSVGAQVSAELKAKAEESAAKAAERSLNRELAKARWTLDNEGKRWKDLAKEERDAYVAQFTAARKAKAEGAPAEPLTETPVPIQQQAMEAAQAELAKAEASGGPVATKAAEEKVKTAEAVSQLPQTPEVPPQPPTSPTLDKAPVRPGMSPVVAEVARRMELRQALTALGEKFDPNAPIPTLEAQLQSLTERSAILKPREGPAKSRAETMAEEAATSRTPAQDVLWKRGQAVVYELDHMPYEEIGSPRHKALQAELLGITKQLSDEGKLAPEAQFGQEDIPPSTVAPPAPSEASALTEPSGGTASSPPRVVAVAEQPVSAKIAGTLKPYEDDLIAAQSRAAEQKPSNITTDIPPAVPEKPVVESPLAKISDSDLDKMETAVVDKVTFAKTDAEREALLKELEPIKAEMARREKAKTTESERPYKNLTPEELQSQRDALELKLQDESLSKVDRRDAQSRLTEMKKEINTRKILAEQARQQAPRKTVAPVPIEVTVKPLTAKDFRIPPSKLSDAMLERQIAEIPERISNLDPHESGPWSERLAKLVEEKALRKSKPSGPDGAPPIGSEFKNLYTHPSVTSFAVGASYGYFEPLPPEDEHKRASRMFMWGLGTSVGWMGAKYLLARRAAMAAPGPKASEAIPGINQFKKAVYSAEDLEGGKVSIQARTREFYAGLIRAIDGIERIPFRKDLPTQKNPAKLAEMSGSYAAQNERWMTTKVDYINPETGNPEPILIDDKPVLPLGEIVEKKARGNKEALGNLATALSTMELAGKGWHPDKLPMTIAQAEHIIANSPDWLMEAAKELRRFNLAGAYVQMKNGLISQDTFNKFAEEDWYTPFHRIVEQLEGIAKTRTDKVAAKRGLYMRKGGSNKPVLNPVDVTMSMTARILRSAEYNNILTQLVDRVYELPKDIQTAILQPVGKQLNKHALNVDGLEAEMRKWANISMADAKAMLAYMDPEAINGKPGVISYFRNGEIQSYRVNADIFRAVKALSPAEMEMTWRMLGLPARFASKGVIYSPAFVANQFIMDSFHAYLLSEYGFRPGIDSFRGWWHEFRGSKKYQDLLAAGGPTSLQSLPYLASETRAEALRLSADAPYKLAWKQMKEMKLWDAYKTIVLPFANSARVGEYLRALDHGASTIEAAYAAQNLIGNYRMQGGFQAMRVFNYLTMFSRPAIAAMDKTLERIGWHPYREPRYSQDFMGGALKEMGASPRVAASAEFLTKAFVGLTLPSMMLWYFNHGDKEIEDVRKTTIGQRYWFFRAGDNSIIRVRRPQVVGEIFGASAEAVLDKMYDKDPEGTMKMAGALWDDVALNVIPQIGVVPLSLMTNYKIGWGSPITPSSDKNLDPNMQGADNASLPSRIIADAVSPISQNTDLEALRRAMSPAGLDYAIGTIGGMMGQDALKALDAALVYRDKGYLPAKEELPLISRYAVKYPSMNVKDVQEFYNRDEKVQAAAGTVKELATSDPTLLLDYYTHNMDRIQLIKVHDEVRQKVADLRRAIDDIQHMPDGMVEREVRDATIKQFTQLIIDHMKIANDLARQMKENR